MGDKIKIFADRIEFWRGKRRNTRNGEIHIHPYSHRNAARVKRVLTLDKIRHYDEGIFTEIVLK